MRFIGREVKELKSGRRSNLDTVGQSCRSAQINNFPIYDCYDRKIVKIRNQGGAAAPPYQDIVRAF
jgi:hypothetical protein